MLRRVFVRFSLLIAASLAGCGPEIGDDAALTADTQSLTYSDAPIVLVHGFAGFGPNEALGFKYWGGLDNLEPYLNSQGRKTYTAVVGPFSSNWDRAVELYYQIKGGCVDYGATHSNTFKHYRGVMSSPAVTKCWHRADDPRTAGFPEALYPQWDQNHPIHLVAHSMGAQTVKMLVQLLEANGAPLEVGLFNGAKHGWVRSVTSLCGALNGTTMTKVVPNYVPMIKQLLTGIAAFTGTKNEDNFIYNFKVEQWGLKRNDGEGFLHYKDRVLASNLWDPVSNRDISLWSLSPEGAAEENSWVQTYPNVYYFSVATKTTFKGLFGWSYGTFATNPIVAVFAGPGAMGSYSGSGIVNTNWRPNDSVVNTISMKVPWNASSQVVTFDGTARIGKWNYMGLHDGFDHFDLTNWLPVVQRGVLSVPWLGYRKFFREHATLLSNLP